MSEMVKTCAANVAEGNEVRVGGVFVVCEHVEHTHDDEGSVATVRLWLDGERRSFWAEELLEVIA